MAVGYGPLSGVTVVDLTQFLSGPLATMIMADLGADVIKVERPDRPKASGPFLNGERVYDLSVQRSKKSITLNLKAETDKKVLLELVKKADVLVENFKPGTMERMGLGYDIIAAANPRIIYMAVSGFGYTGPYRSRGALDMIVQGMSGLMSLTGEPDRPRQNGPGGEGRTGDKYPEPDRAEESVAFYAAGDWGTAALRLSGAADLPGTECDRLFENMGPRKVDQVDRDRCMYGGVPVRGLCPVPACAGPQRSAGLLRRRYTYGLAA